MSRRSRTSKARSFAEISQYQRNNPLPRWVFLSLVANGFLTLVTIWLLKDYWSPIEFQVNASTTRTSLQQQIPNTGTDLGPRHRLTYNRWVGILAQEAKVVAASKPENLNILAGDSLSLWIPPDLLPPDKTWLNQGISGETSDGLLDRLKLFDKTQPKTIFVMIGINDLIRGVSDQKILENYQRIVRRLRRVHPQTEIVVQSILPHGAEASTWEGRDRLLAIPNQRIRDLNQQLQAIASAENVKYLDLYTLFSNQKGDLRPEFSTDGLHLSRPGYLIWSSALQIFTQIQRSPTPDWTSPTTNVEPSTY